MEVVLGCMLGELDMAVGHLCLARARNMLFVMA